MSRDGVPLRADIGQHSLDEGKAALDLEKEGGIAGNTVIEEFFKVHP